MKNKTTISKTKMLTLIRNLDWRSVRAALHESPELLTYRGDRGQNLLHVCCSIEIERRGLKSTDSINTTAALLNAGLDVNQEAFAEGDWKATPLWYAISRGKNAELAKYLLARGSSPEHCLWAAAFNDDPSAVRLLVRAGATVDARGDETPFLFAIRWSHFEAARALLVAGADPNVQNQDGRTAMHYMLKKRSDAKHVNMLLKYGARLDLPDRNGVTAGSMLSRVRSREYRKLTSMGVRNSTPSP